MFFGSSEMISQRGNGELRFLFLEILLCLLIESSDLRLKILGVLRHERKPGQQDEKCTPGFCRQVFSQCITYTTFF